MNIVIVEDEPLVQQRTERLSKEILEDYDPKFYCFSDIDDAQLFLSENTIELVLLDLNLMGRNGFDLLKNNVAAAYHTIVISAYDEKAIEAFEYGVLDFIAKPFTKERLEKAMARFLNNTQRSYYGCRYLSVKKAGAIELIEISDIGYIQAEGHYSLLHLTSSDLTTNLHAKNIEKIMQLLPENFVRVHRSYIVNINLVKRLNIEDGSRYSLTLTTGQQVPVGRTRYQSIKQLLAT